MSTQFPNDELRLAAARRVVELLASGYRCRIGPLGIVYYECIGANAGASVAQVDYFKRTNHWTIFIGDIEFSAPSQVRKKLGEIHDSAGKKQQERLAKAEADALCAFLGETI